MRKNSDLSNHIGDYCQVCLESNLNGPLQVMYVLLISLPVTDWLPIG